jgi:hypothetical protein
MGRGEKIGARTADLTSDLLFSAFRINSIISSFILSYDGQDACDDANGLGPKLERACNFQ